MAFDVGIKRIGIAVSDPLKMIATALTTSSPNDIGPFLANYLKQEQVDTFVVGMPLTLGGNDSQSGYLVRQFADWLMQHYGTGRQLHWVDERFTSIMAKQAIIDSGIKKMERRNKALTDSVSATLILQTFLSTHS